MNLYIGVLIFGILTGNIMASIGWILLKAFALLNPTYEALSVGVLVLICMARKIIRSTGVS